MTFVTNYDVCRIMIFVAYCVCCIFKFVALLCLLHYCMMFVAYSVCCIIMFDKLLRLSHYYVCLIMTFVAYRVCRIILSSLLGWNKQL